MGRLSDITRRVTTTIEDTARLDALSEPVSGLVKKATKRASVKNALSGSWLGHQLHPMLTDLPIGAWTAAAVLDLTAGERGSRAAQRLVGLGVLASAPTAAAGASDWADTHGPTQRVGIVHALANSAATVLQVASWLARRNGNHGLGVRLSTLGLCLTFGSAYLGGHLSLVRGVGVNHTAFQEPEANWTDVAAEADLQDDASIRVIAGGVPVALVKQRGRVHALSAVCTHAGGPLDEGTLVDGCVKCPWHGSEFRLDDGEVKRGPASVAQPVWDVKVEVGRVSVRPRAA